VAFSGLRKPRISTDSNRTIHHVPGLLAVIPAMYIPMINCVRVIAEKKAAIRFLLRVSAYKLLKT